MTPAPIQKTHDTFLVQSNDSLAHLIMSPVERPKDMNIYRQHRFIYGSLCAVVGILWTGSIINVSADDTNSANSIERVLSGKTPPSRDDLLPFNERFTTLSPRLIRSTVGVKMEDSCGSGVAITQEGHILTAAHVIGNSHGNIHVLLNDQRTVKAHVVGIDPLVDLALLKVDSAVNCIPVKLSRGSGISAGQWCLATGFPGCWNAKVEPTVRMGRVLKTSQRAVVTDCVLDRGDSGGPLFDMSGRLIGIHSRIGKRLLDNSHIPVQIFLERRAELFHSRSNSGRDRSFQKPVKNKLQRDRTSTHVRVSEFLRHRGSPLEIGRNHETVKSAFHGVIDAANASIVQFIRKNRRVALGTIVSSDGYVLTTQNNITRAPICRLADGRRLQSHKIGLDPSSGLVLLKIDAHNLHPIQFTKQPNYSLGSIVATPNGRWDIPVAIGIVSRTTRRSVKKSESTNLNRDPDSLHTTDRSGFGQHRSGFSTVIEHDTVVPPHLCGGPVVNVTGTIIGINISRVSRTTTYAIPAEIAQQVVQRLKSFE